jgi:hypothetical protein
MSITTRTENTIIVYCLLLLHFLIALLLFASKFRRRLHMLTASILQYITSDLSCYDTKCKICQISENFCLYQCMKIADSVYRSLHTYTVLKRKEKQ